MTTQVNRKIRRKGWVLGLGLGVLVLAATASPTLARDDGRDNRHRRGGPPTRETRDYRRPAPVTIINNHAPRHHHHKPDTKNKVGVNVSFGHPVHTTTVVQRVWVPERYEDRVEQVCVEPERYELRYIPEVRETRYDPCGRPYTIIHHARHERVLIPARYETRVTRVCIPGYYQDVVEQRPVARTTTTISIGGVFRF